MLYIVLKGIFCNISSAKTELQYESHKHRSYHATDVHPHLEASLQTEATITNTESDLNLEGPNWSPTVEADHVFELNGHIIGIKVSHDNRYVVVGSAV